MSSNASTLVANLVSQLEQRPEAEVSRLLDAAGTPTSVTIEQLLRRAMAFAAQFGRAKQRSPIAVCLYHGLDLHAAFLGAMWSGHLPTMIAPPSPRMEPAKYAGSFGEMLAHVRPKFVVTDSTTITRLAALDVSSFRGAEIIDPATVQDEGFVPPHPAHTDDVAVLQHSSGTTGVQKGVALTHRAILDHNRVYRDRLMLSDRDVIVSWLPLYHDMGFIACFLLPLLERVLLVEMSPFDWVARPALLLESITRHRGTLCWLPNFAFQFLADSVRLEEFSEPIDLSSIRMFINSSEPVMDASNRAFLAKFERCGVHRGQLTSSYAMAENVYAVTQSVAGRYRTIDLDHATFIDSHRVVSGRDLTFVSNGAPVDGTELVVLDDNGQVITGDRVGELAIRGVARFDGYYGRDDLTSAAILPDGFYKTGDLGFVHEGEVFVTGRKKDLIIIQGRNFYPPDIERVVGEIQGTIPGRVVAFGVGDPARGTEGLIVLAESVLALDVQPRLLLEIRRRIAQTLDCTPTDVRIVPERWLIKSTSGKLARDDNRRKYLSMYRGAGT